MARLLRLLLLATGLCLLLACHPIEAPPPAYRNTLLFASPPAMVAQYGLLELPITTDITVANPYDPDQIDLRVHFTGPHGQVLTVPAFWMQPYDLATQLPRGKPGWRVRFTPNMPGEWQAQAELAIPAQQSPPIHFTVTPTANPGFVRIHPTNPNYFAFDDGSFYFPIGLNLGWSTGAVLADYTRWLDRLSANGGNIARVWMAPWSFTIEWQETGLGDYTARMQQAWLLDQIFHLAEERGVYIMLTLINHGQFSTSVNPEWADNPYNAANGGPCPNPIAFVTDPTAKEFFKRRLRYIAARWAYSPNLLAWEWWNEVNWTGIGDQDLGPWIREMTPVLQAFDPYDHLITNSYANGTRTQIWGLPEIDFSQQHDYTGGDLNQTLADDLRRIQAVAPNKPVLMGELGYSAGAQENLDAMHLHVGLWAAPFLGYAGGSMYWWWDNFIDPQNQWPQYGALATFFQGEDLAVLTPTTAAVAPEGAQALLLQGSDRVLVWVRSDGYSVPAAQSAYDKAVRDALKSKQKLTEWSYAAPLLRGRTVTLTGLADGAYTVRWFAPQSGAWMETATVQVSGGTAIVALPDFDMDIAFSVTPQE
ncbi:MAG: DUF5060 domain-containing protein [Caldilineaceae bacterium]